ncbi:MAG: DUF5906 domain-containing protein [Clostridiales Family XIII bacterium]|jgi:hypothetical protein|nr:DUF5906 domain-containing protein [Clostridiales Family XIII bacterium]
MKQKGRYVPVDTNALIACFETASRNIHVKSAQEVEVIKLLKRKSKPCTVEAKDLPIKDIENNNLIGEGDFTQNYIDRKITDISIANLRKDFNSIKRNPINDFFYRMFSGDFELYESLLSALAQPFVKKGSHFINLWGTGLNGKSTLQDLILKTFGENNVSNVEISALKQQDVVQGLNLKLYNNSDEADYRNFNADMLKKLTTWGPVVAQRKYSADPVTVWFRGVFIIGSNKILETPDKTPAFFERLCQFQLKYRFKRNKEGDKAMHKMFTPKMLDYFASIIVTTGKHIWNEKDGVYLTSSQKNDVSQLYRQDNDILDYLLDHPLKRKTRCRYLFQTIKESDEYELSQFMKYPGFRKQLIQLGYKVKKEKINDKYNYYVFPLK